MMSNENRTVFFPPGLPRVERVELTAPCLNEILRDAYKRSDVRSLLVFGLSMTDKNAKRELVEARFILGEESHSAPDFPRLVGAELIRWGDDVAPRFDRRHSDEIFQRLVDWSKDTFPIFLEVA